MVIHMSICLGVTINLLVSKGNYSAASNNTKLVHWPLMGGLLPVGAVVLVTSLTHVSGAIANVQIFTFTFDTAKIGAFVGCCPAQSPSRCTKCNSSPINGQCTNHCIAI